MILLVINDKLLDLTLILSDLDIYLLVYISIEYDLVKICKTSKKGGGSFSFRLFFFCFFMFATSELRHLSSDFYWSHINVFKIGCVHLFLNRNNWFIRKSVRCYVSNSGKLKFLFSLVSKYLPNYCQ